MRQNTRAGLIPEIVLKDIMYDSNKEWHCSVLQKLQVGAVKVLIAA